MRLFDAGVQLVDFGARLFDVGAAGVDAAGGTIFPSRAQRPAMSVYETDIPGVGRKFELELSGGGRAVALIHHDGRAELFYREHADADAEKLLDLTSDEANRLGSILEGAYFEPVDVDALSVPLGGDIIEWTEIEEWSPLAGTTLRSADVRARTGVSVIAVQRGTETIANPDPECELRPGDLLVSVGSREQQNALWALVAGEDVN